MEFSGVTIETSENVTAAIDRILASNLSPADKQARIALLLRNIGTHFYSQMYGASSQIFDSTNMVSAGLATNNDQEKRLANKLVRNYALGRETAPLISGYFNSILGQSQYEAFDNANMMQRHPILTRSIVSETCTWCAEKSGVHTNPTSEDFARHRKCDCIFAISGYNSRNGLLSNYSKVYERDLVKQERFEQEVAQYGKELTPYERGIITRIKNAADSNRTLTSFEKHLRDHKLPEVIN